MGPRARRAARGIGPRAIVNALALHRALAGIAAETRRPGPTASQWVEALALVAATEPVPGHYRVVELTVGGAARAALCPFEAADEIGEPHCSP